jgi:general secretion pathway protein G
MVAITVQRLRGFARGSAPMGFTLIELMVVIVIIGVIAAIVVPQLSGSSDTVRLETAAQRIGDMMDFCYHAAASSGKVHALLLDPANRRMDVVCESATPPPEEAATDPGAVTGDATAAPTSAPTPAATPVAAPESDTSATGEDEAAAGANPAAASGTAPTDPNAPINLVPVSIPAFMDHTLPEGISVSATETYEAGLTEGANEGQFKILFFPDGTTEFARVEVSTEAGQRREVWLHGLGGTVSVTDPDREGELSLASMIVDEDNPDAAADTEDQSNAEEPQPDATPQPME